MRIALVAHSDAPWTPHYTRYCLSRGDTILLVSFAPRGIEGVEMEYVGPKEYDPTRHKHLFLTRVPRVRRILRRFRPDLVYAPYLASNGLTAVLASVRPVVVGARGSDVLFDETSSLPRYLHEARARFVCSRAAVVHTVSRGIDDELVRLGVHASRLVCIPVGVNASTFHPSADMPRPDAKRFICTRKHEVEYDIPTILHALARLRAAGREFRATFAAGGTKLETHKSQAQAAGLEPWVTFTGDLVHERIPALLREADVYISASHTDGTSSSLLEGMATGLLPVVSDIDANQPWIEHGRTGLLFPVGRPDALAKTLERAQDDPELRRRAFQENPRRVASEADMQRNMDRLAAVFDQVAEGCWEGKSDQQLAPTRG
jgi:L-malate glycosyltransferase